MDAQLPTEVVAVAAVGEVSQPAAEMRDRAGPEVRVKVDSGEVRATVANIKAVEEEAPAEVTVSRWLREAPEEGAKPAELVAALAAPATVEVPRPAPAKVEPAKVEQTKSRPAKVAAAVAASAAATVKPPQQADQQRPRTWPWVMAAAVGLVTWMMIGSQKSEVRTPAASAPTLSAAVAGAASDPSMTVLQDKPAAPSTMGSTRVTPAAPVVAIAAPMVPSNTPAPNTEVASPTNVAPAAVVEIAKPIAVVPDVPKIAEASVAEPIAAPHVAADPEILALAQRIAAADEPQVEPKSAAPQPAAQVGPQASVAHAQPRPTSVSGTRQPIATNWYDQVPPKAADNVYVSIPAPPASMYDNVLPLAAMQVAGESPLSRGRQYDHVPPRAAMPQDDVGNE